MQKDVYYITDLEQLRVISDPLRIRVLWEIELTAKTGKMIADQLEVPAPKVHYHLKELEKVGLIEVERVEEKNGIMQKFYRPIAKAFSLDKISFQQPEELTVLSNSVRENMIVQLDKTKSLVKKVDDTSFTKEKNLMTTHTLRLTSEQSKVLGERFTDLFALLKQYEHQENNEEKSELYHVTLIGFPVIESTYPEE